jgi:hypothetical protein
MLLTALPIEVQIVIMGHLAVILEQSMDDLYNLRAICSSMCRICGDPAVDRCLALDRFRRKRTWDDPIDYEALLASLTQIGNLEACFLTGIQNVFMEKHSSWPCLDDLACTLMAGIIWQSIWSPYCSIGTMAMPATTTLRGGT